MKIEIKATQTIDYHSEITIQKGKGTIKQYKKGVVIFGEMAEGNSFQMTILEDKILLKKQNQTMIFKIGSTTKSIQQTPYGNLNMKITTKQIKVTKQQDTLYQILLCYNIQLENTEPYENKIEITLK
ncbi:MAG: DUF1934 domain-containing protein [Clostridia bacterium]|nr:DUF1934 domain-containing protein [Clostridia bacterium]